MQHLDELAQLADFLEHFDKRRPGTNWFFHLHTWYADTGHLTTDLIEELRSTIPDLPYSDAYIACSIGYLAHAVPNTSLRLNNNYLPEPIYTTNNGYQYCGWEAIAHYFGLTPQQTDYLFSAHNHANPHSPTYAAIRIRAFLAAHDAI